MIYTVYLEPIATDAIFVPGKVISLKGNFNGENNNSFNAIRRPYIFPGFHRYPAETLHDYSAIRLCGLFASCLR